jgi:tetratricopeptide (TPR) repeat protein
MNERNLTMTHFCRTPLTGIRLAGCTLIALLGIASQSAVAADTATASATAFDTELRAIAQEWAAAKYQTEARTQREAAFAALIDHSARFSAAHPDRAEAVAWEGIVLSTYAGEVGALSAMKYAKAARQALERAEALDGSALSGGIYSSLGTLYFKVPGGLLGFGDDARARQYFEKALAVDAGNIDTNYFYAEFMLDQGNARAAVVALNRALATPADPARPVFENGRRAEIRTLLAKAERAAS